MSSALLRTAFASARTLLRSRAQPMRFAAPAAAAMGMRSIASAKDDTLGKVIAETLGGMKSDGVYKSERVITSPQSSTIHVRAPDGTQREVKCFCANNYLGLAHNEMLEAAAHDTIQSHGFGLSSVRFICGTQDIHKELEKKIAAFHAQDDTILYASCFDANAGLFEALLTPEDAIISDELNHASIIDGVRLCKAQRHRYKHIDMANLEAKLRETQDCRIRMIATDGVFSMDGDIAPLDEICDLADEYDAVVMIDECHATGFFGPTGRGTDEYKKVRTATTNRIDIINSTLGKALGGATGGYTAARQDVVDLLRQKSRPYLFSNSVSPVVVGASLKCFDMLSSSTDLVDKVAANTELFRSRMTAAGFTIGGAGHPHPIVPIMLGDARLASEFADDMLERGIYVIGFSFPVVPRGQARIRVQLSAAHSTEDVEECVEAFIAVGKERGVIQ